MRFWDNWEAYVVCTRYYNLQYPRAISEICVMKFPWKLRHCAATLRMLIESIPLVSLRSLSVATTSVAYSTWLYYISALLYSFGHQIKITVVDGILYFISTHFVTEKCWIRNFWIPKNKNNRINYYMEQCNIIALNLNTEVIIIIFHYSTSIYIRGKFIVSAEIKIIILKFLLKSRISFLFFRMSKKKSKK